MKYRSGLSERPDLQLVYLCLCVSSQRSSQMRKGILMREPRRIWAGIKHHVKCVSVGEKKKKFSVNSSYHIFENNTYWFDKIDLILFSSRSRLPSEQRDRREGTVCRRARCQDIWHDLRSVKEAILSLFFPSYSASLFPQWDGFWIEGVRTVRSENCVRFPLGEGSRGGEIEEDKIAQGDFSCCCKLFLAFNRCLW